MKEQQSTLIFHALLRGNLETENQICRMAVIG